MNLTKTESKALVELQLLAEQQFAKSHNFHLESVHGRDHWTHVKNNALLLEQQYGPGRVDMFVVLAFCLMHDCCRHNDGTDYGHGKRASEFLWTAGNSEKFLAFLGEDRLRKICFAIAHHTDGLYTTPPDIETAICWDADRLDLGRIGIIPLIGHMFTEAGRAFAVDLHRAGNPQVRFTAIGKSCHSHYGPLGEKEQSLDDTISGVLRHLSDACLMMDVGDYDGVLRYLDMAESDLLMARHQKGSEK